MAAYRRHARLPGSPQKYTGTIAAPGDVTAKIQSTALLFNGYIDLGTWYRLTPYIGAGAGFVARPTISALAPPFIGRQLRISQWNFAWAAMFGMAYTVAPNLKIDFGYRYLNIGDVSTASDDFGAMNFRNIAAHEAARRPALEFR